MVTSLPTSKPSVLSLDGDAIPAELRSTRAWVAWRQGSRSGRWTKEPINPITGGLASADDPNTWTDFQMAMEGYRRWGCDGIGLCRTDDLIFVDLDGVLDLLGNLRAKTFPWVKKILRLLQGRAYLEKSVSGTGIHGVCRGKLPPGRRQHDDPLMNPTGFAFYDKNRYFTFTGDVLPQSGPISDCTEEINRLYADLFPSTLKINGHSQHVVAHVDLSDEELLTRALELLRSQKMADSNRARRKAGHRSAGSRRRALAYFAFSVSEKVGTEVEAAKRLNRRLRLSSLFSQ